VCILGVDAVAADLKQQTTEAYERYLQEATEDFLARIRGGEPTTGIRIPPARASSLRDGEVLVSPGRQDGIVGVPGGLVHHWIGVTFIGDITVEDALRISCAYDDYHAFYKSVIGSRLLGRDGDTYRIALRIREGAAGITAVLDVNARVQYYPDGSGVYSVSSSEEIREVKNAGSPNERLLPAGQDSGYLWRAATFNRLVKQGNGVLVEMETLGLSRSFPSMLGWFIEPIARRLGHKSIELSLQEFRSAVRERKSL
jgi:hypothetical protein